MSEDWSLQYKICAHCETDYPRDEVFQMAPKRIGGKPCCCKPCRALYDAGIHPHQMPASKRKKLAAMPEWQRVHEESKSAFLAEARTLARELLQTRDTITVDDIRERLEIPEGMDKRVMGAVFNHKHFEGTGDYVKSRRADCHHRPVQKFRRARTAKAEAA